MSYVALRRIVIAWVLADFVIGPILVGACFAGFAFCAFMGVIAYGAYHVPWELAGLAVLFVWWLLYRGTARLIWRVVQTAERHW